VTKGAERYKGHTELSAGVDDTAGLVQRLKRRVLGLDGVDLGDYDASSVSGVFRGMRCELSLGYVILLASALRSVAAEGSERPMYLVLPDLRRPSRAVIDSSRGVSSWRLVVYPRRTKEGWPSCLTY
jgi:hypothetical protein